MGRVSVAVDPGRLIVVAVASGNAATTLAGVQEARSKEKAKRGKVNFILKSYSGVFQQAEHIYKMSNSKLSDFRLNPSALFHYGSDLVFEFTRFLFQLHQLS